MKYTILYHGCTTRDPLPITRVGAFRKLPLVLAQALGSTFGAVTPRVQALKVAAPGV
jgi:hypothetical protein